MSQWDVVTVLVALVGLYLAIYNPMSKNTKDNTKAMTELTVTMQNFAERLELFEKNNHSSHARIFEKLDGHEEKIHQHENELIRLKEGK